MPSQVREVGQDEIDAEVLVAREGEPGVDDDVSPPFSKTVMFFPTSPRPPSGMMRSASHGQWRQSVLMGRGIVGGPRRPSATAATERRPERASRQPRDTRLALVLGRLDERQAEAADLVAEQVQRRLDRDRVRRRP